MTILTAPVPAVRPTCAPPRYASWQEALRDAIRDPAELCRVLELPDEVAEAARQACAASPGFSLFAPRGFVSRMRPGDVNDPLLRQVLPVLGELEEAPGFVRDPVGDLEAERQPGLLHKYAGRVLLVTTGVCAVHCRYCFRRHFPYSDGPRSLADWRPALEAIADDSSIREVILSGGDPLVIVDRTVGQLVDALAEIPHLKRLRIHTRLPIVIPERVTDELIDIVRGTRFTPVVVVHANHANEINAHVAAALAQLSDAGVPLLNQAVLLRGVNDTAAAQAALCEKLVDHRVLPYYLHQLDRVAGAAHFDVPIETGRRIVAELRDQLPGYAVPRFVAELPAELSKTILE
ncbi:MAG: EF-P beta-lysylation protein EpmB [Pirellulales bacterium]